MVGLMKIVYLNVILSQPILSIWKMVVSLLLNRKCLIQEFAHFNLTCVVRWQLGKKRQEFDIHLIYYCAPID